MVGKSLSSPLEVEGLISSWQPSPQPCVLITHFYQPGSHLFPQHLKLLSTDSFTFTNSCPDFLWARPPRPLAPRSVPLCRAGLHGCCSSRTGTARLGPQRCLRPCAFLAPPKAPALAASGVLKARFLLLLCPAPGSGFAAARPQGLARSSSPRAFPLSPSSAAAPQTLVSAALFPGINHKRFLYKGPPGLLFQSASRASRF